MCFRPINLKNPNGPGYIQVPCGHCLDCLRKYQNDWTNRFDAELKACNGKAVFFTLTYDDANVPKNYLYDGEVYRSPSAYGFTNIDPLTGKIRQAYHGERKKYAQVPYVELQSLGVDCSHILDFNLKRKDNKTYIAHIKKLFHDYYALHANSEGVLMDASHDSESEVAPFDFDAYLDSAEGEEMIQSLFEGDAVDDAEYYESSIEEETPDKAVLRERPVIQFNSVRAQDVQDWVKRGRIKLERKCKRDGIPVKKFKFFITSEYGPRTLRPHYHGIIFGVTAADIAFMRSDWSRRYGRRIQWEDVDLSKGAGSYVAKYCSKGFFEHPLCARNFFYTHGRPVSGDSVDEQLMRERFFTEYHSKHYERCIEIFGIDAPIVDPTFHLVSQGLGVSFVERNGERLRDSFVESLDYKRDVVNPTLDVYRKKYASIDFACGEGPESFSTELFPEGHTPHTVPCLGRIKLERKEDVQLNPDRPDFLGAYEAFSKAFRYYRVQRKDGVEKVFSYSMPLYYRKKILGDNLLAAYSAFVRAGIDAVYQEKLRQFRANNPSVSLSQACDALDAEEKQERLIHLRKMVKDTSKFYNKSKL